LLDMGSLGDLFSTYCKLADCERRGPEPPLVPGSTTLFAHHGSPTGRHRVGAPDGEEMAQVSECRFSTARKFGPSFATVSASCVPYCAPVDGPHRVIREAREKFPGPGCQPQT
jgi:hypothetical protein